MDSSLQPVHCYGFLRIDLLATLPVTDHPNQVFLLLQLLLRQPLLLQVVAAAEAEEEEEEEERRKVYSKLTQ
jgi:hypothetical protein